MSFVTGSVISGVCVVFTFLGAVGMHALGDGVAVDAEGDRSM